MPSAQKWFPFFLIFKTDLPVLNFFRCGLLLKMHPRENLCEETDVIFRPADDFLDSDERSCSEKPGLKIFSSSFSSISETAAYPLFFSMQSSICLCVSGQKTVQFESPPFLGSQETAAIDWFFTVKHSCLCIPGILFQRNFLWKEMENAKVFFCFFGQ